MNFKIPKNDTKYHWTNHVIRKMVFYGLSPDRVKRVIRKPKRVEDGVAENTIAVMQFSSNLKKPTEIWVMYQEKNQNAKIKMQNLGKKVIISAWRYSGVSSVGKQIPIPANILEELKKDGIISGC